MSHHIKGTLFVAVLLIAAALLIQLTAAPSSITLVSGLFLLSLVGLVKAADVFTDLAVIVGEALGLSKLNTGILIIAIGTSAPELFSSISAALQGENAIVVGNVLGTVIANSLLAIGIAAVVAKEALTVHKDVHGTQMSLFLVSVLLVCIGLNSAELSRFNAVILLVTLVFYLHHTIKNNRPDENDSPENHSAKPSMAPLIGLLVISLVALFISGDYVVKSLMWGAELMQLSSAKLATSLLAIGTSIPEIATAIMLVRKGNSDSLFGEILGSNIFDILGIFGLIALFQPISMNGPLLDYLLISSVVMFLTLFVIMNDRKINRLEGVALLALYAAFLGQLNSI